MLDMQKLHQMRIVSFYFYQSPNVLICLNTKKKNTLLLMISLCRQVSNFWSRRQLADVTLANPRCIKITPSFLYIALNNDSSFKQFHCSFSALKKQSLSFNFIHPLRDESRANSDWNSSCKGIPQQSLNCPKENFIFTISFDN